MVSNSSWYRQNFRAWHWTYTSPSADLVGNAAGPEPVYSAYGSGLNRVRQDPMETNGCDKNYYYNIKVN